MDRTEALERMDEIRRIAERTTLYTVLPGVPAVVGGVLALAGCAGTYAMTGRFESTEAPAFSVAGGGKTVSGFMQGGDLLCADLLVDQLDSGWRGVAGLDLPQQHARVTPFRVPFVALAGG